MPPTVPLTRVAPNTANINVKWPVDLAMRTYDDSGLTFPWKEYTGQTPGYTQSWVLGARESACALVIDVPWGELVNGNAVRQILGVTQHVGEGKLNRTPPWRHPIQRDMYATKIANAAGIGFLGMDNNAPIAFYRYARLSIVFEKLPYALWTDAELQTGFDNKEYHRWTLIRAKGSVEYFEYAPGFWRFDTLAAPQIQFPINKRVQSGRIEVNWYDVPRRALFVPGELLPGNIMPYLGLVNSVPFGGIPAEKLLLVDASWTERESPIAVPGFAGPNVHFDVKFDIAYTNPPMFAGQVGGGYNAAPFPGTGKYVVVRAANNDRPYVGFDFATLFEAVP